MISNVKIIVEYTVPIDYDDPDEILKRIRNRDYGKPTETRTVASAYDPNGNLIFYKKEVADRVGGITIRKEVNV